MYIDEIIFLLYVLYATLYTMATMLFVTEKKNKIMKRIFLITNVLSIVFWLSVIVIIINEKKNVLKEFWNDRI